jgi:hypothetical protein
VARDLIVGGGSGTANELMRVTAGGNVGIGTAVPNEKITIEGSISLDELGSPPTSTAGYGKLYVKSDKKLYFQDSVGSETDLLAGTVGSSCPSGFTSVEFNGNRLGCVQTDEANSGTPLNWTEAQDFCWDTFGARLPSGGELRIALDNYVLNSEGDGKEWTGELEAGSGHRAIGLNGSSHQVSTIGSNEDFRCWIPGSGQGTGDGTWSENGTDIYRNSGNVGIGTTSPNVSLAVDGAIRAAASVTNATSTVDFQSGNLQHTTNSCGSFNLHNLKDGASYLFAVQGSTSATCSFSAYSDAGVTSLTMHMPPDHAATTASKHTVYTFAVMGTHVYAAWTPDL